MVTFFSVTLSYYGAAVWPLTVNRAPGGFDSCSDQGGDFDQKVSCLTCVFITVNGSSRSDEAHQESVRRRLLYTYSRRIENLLCLIVTNDAPIERYRKN